MTRIRLATRGSALALAQAEMTERLLRALDAEIEVERVIVRTHGDASKAPLSAMSGVGVFVKEIEECLRRDEADLAVHSLKDLPTAETGGLTVVAMLEREDPRDALIVREGGGLADLESGARVATSSPRRRAQLLAARPDLELVEVRGNVDTRISKLRAGEFEAIVLALAGLRRLGRADEVTEVLEPDVMLPAPGQGAVALQARAGSPAAAIAARLDHPETRAAVVAERTMLLALGGGCAVPVAALATVAGDRVELAGLVADPDGGGRVRAGAAGLCDEAEHVGRSLANALATAGARAILDRQPGAQPLTGRRVLITRRREQAAELAARLESLGADVAIVPAIEIAAPADDAPLRAAIEGLERYAAIAFTSVNGVERFSAALEAAGRSPDDVSGAIGAVGPATAAALRERGYAIDTESLVTTGAGLADALTERLAAGARVLIARAEDGRPELADGLGRAGMEVDDVATHRMVPATGLEEGLTALEPVDWVVYASPSAVRSVAAIGSDRLAAARVACIGATTATAAREAGLDVAACPERAVVDDLVGAIVRATLDAG